MSYVHQILFNNISSLLDISSVETIKICATPIWLFVLHNSLFRSEGEYFNCSWHLIYSFIFFFPLRVLIASNSKINGYESLVRILAWLFYVWHCQKIQWQWNKHERNKYFAFASASAAIAITNTRRAISTFTLFTICCTFFSSLYFYVISIYSILFGWCMYKFFFGILEFLKPCEVWFTCVIYLWQ